MTRRQESRSLVVGLGRCAYVVVALVVASTSACSNGSDEPAAALRLGSAGLARDLLLTHDSTAPEQRRARSTDQVVLLATSFDPSARVHRVALKGEVRVECVPVSGSNIVHIVDPIAEEATATNAGDLPTRLSKQFTLNVLAQRARCPTATRFLELRLRLHAEAENGAGERRTTPDAIVDSYGPDTVRVASFNLYNPGRHQDAVFERWGRQLVSQADVAFLQEVPDERRARLVADSAGMPYLAYFVNTAIASRAPLRNLNRRDVDGSIIISAETDLERYPHQIVGVHFTTSDANGIVKPWLSSAWRVKASEELLSMLKPSPGIVIAGGDFNSYSGIGPQIEAGGTKEIDLLRAALTDVYSALGLPDEAHCSNQRIDYILVRGPYSPAEYKACFPESEGSDHPFVWARLVAG